MKKKFTKGLLLGLVAGVLATKYLETPEGKKKKAELKKKANVLLYEAQEKMKGLKKPTKAQYDKVVTKVVDSYAKRKDIAKGVKGFLTEYLKKHWEDFDGGK